MIKVLVLYSGGLDGRVLLQHALEQHHAVGALAFDYEQVNKQELHCAIEVCEELDVPISVMKAPFFMSLGVTSSLIKGPKQEGAELSPAVPNRNMIFLAIAAGLAEVHGFHEVWYGPHLETGPRHPDCSKAFIQAMEDAVAISTTSKVLIKAPLYEYSKADIIALGTDYGVDFNKTWTCYTDNNKACGVCNACKGRLEGFEIAGLIDPIQYEE